MDQITGVMDSVYLFGRLQVLLDSCRDLTTGFRTSSPMGQNSKAYIPQGQAMHKGVI